MEAKRLHSPFQATSDLLLLMVFLLLALEDCRKSDRWAIEKITSDMSLVDRAR